MSQDFCVVCYFYKLKGLKECGNCGYKFIDREPFRPRLTKFDDGQFLTYFVEDCESIATQINNELTVYHSEETGKFVGFRLLLPKGLRSE